LFDDLPPRICFRLQPWRLAGFLVRLGERTIYHAGDTALFGDMEMIGRRHPIDLALLPIGDNYTMGPDDALEAVRLLRPRRVVPIHYNTFDLIAQDPQAFARSVLRLLDDPALARLFALLAQTAGERPDETLLGPPALAALGRGEPK